MPPADPFKITRATATSDGPIWVSDLKSLWDCSHCPKNQTLGLRIRRPACTIPKRLVTSPNDHLLCGLRARSIRPVPFRSPRAKSLDDPRSAEKWRRPSARSTATNRSQVSRARCHEMKQSTETRMSSDNTAISLAERKAAVPRCLRRKYNQQSARR